MRLHLFPFLAAILAGCSAGTSPPPTAPGPADPAGTKEGRSTSAAGETGPAAGQRPPAFRFPALSDHKDLSLDEALALQAGRPLVLVLGAASCGTSATQLEEMAAAALPGPGPKEPGYLAVMTGKPDEVAMVVPGNASFPILLAGEADVLDRYKVVTTPSIVLLDGKGRIAYIGDGGHLDVAAMKDLAGRMARGESIDPAAVHPEGG